MRRIGGRMVTMVPTAGGVCQTTSSPGEYGLGLMPFGKSTGVVRICPARHGKKGHEKKPARRRDQVSALVPTGFHAALRDCFGAVLPALPRRRGRRPRVPLAQSVPGFGFPFHERRRPVRSTFHPAPCGGFPGRQFVKGALLPFARGGFHGVDAAGLAPAGRGGAATDRGKARSISNPFERDFPKGIKPWP